MTDSIYTIALLTIASGMTIIAGILAHLYRERDGQFEAAAKRVNELTTLLEREELLTKRLDENGKKSEETAEYYTNRCAQLTEEIDTLRSTVREYEELCNERQHTIDLLKSERATLYRRNDKGQIEPITPKPRKPHTLKHGMTVKDPTPEHAKRIFREAKRAGLHIGLIAIGDGTFPHIQFTKAKSGDWVSSVIGVTMAQEIEISTTEFIKRIKGEVA